MNNGLDKSFSHLRQFWTNKMPRRKIKMLRKPRLTWTQLSVLAVLYLTSIHIPSQSSNQMVDASVPFRFRFAPNSYGSQTGLGMNRLGTSSLVGSRDRNLISYLYPQSNSHLTGVSHLNKRSYADLQCRGIYDASIFARLERVCEDCYNLYKDDEVLGLCRTDCFGSETFRECLQSLLLNQESDLYMELVEIIGKRKK